MGTLTVTNVASTPGTGVTEVDYEFSGPDGAYDISAKVNFGDGEVFLPIDNADIDGNLTNVEPGVHSLTWNGGISFPGRYHENTVVELTATQVCGENVSVTFTYNGEEVTYGTVWRNGLCWLDRNLGASQVATAHNDHLAYGDLFQWGRGDDGHQVVIWSSSTTGDVTPTTTTLSPTDDPGHGNFIRGGLPTIDWRSPQNDDLWQGEDGINKPCPAGWRVPTEAELNAERESWTDGNNSAGAYASTLKWPVGGYRDSHGTLDRVGSEGLVWGSSVSDDRARYLLFVSDWAHMLSLSRAVGMSVRCVRDL